MARWYYTNFNHTSFFFSTGTVTSSKMYIIQKFIDPRIHILCFFFSSSSSFPPLLSLLEVCPVPLFIQKYIKIRLRALTGSLYLIFKISFHYKSRPLLINLLFFFCYYLQCWRIRSECYPTLGKCYQEVLCEDEQGGLF